METLCTLLYALWFPRLLSIPVGCNIGMNTGIKKEDMKERHREEEMMLVTRKKRREGSRVFRRIHSVNKSYLQSVSEK